ncbi:MAG: 30S ribosomal protein S6 [Kiloniellales bacterium]|nr:30S ribosomal protein S6 [Kiloniellales bacterium]
MPLYESVFIARQDISASQAEGIADQFAKIIEDAGGKVAKREYWGLRGLAYKIKKNRKGHYTLFNIDAPSTAVSEMERNMRLNEDVIRYLTIKVDELEEGPSVMMQARDRRDGGRGGRRFDRDDRRPGHRSEGRGGDRHGGDRRGGDRSGGDRSGGDRSGGDRPAEQTASAEGDKQ